MNPACWHELLLMVVIKKQKTPARCQARVLKLADGQRQLAAYFLP